MAEETELFWPSLYSRLAPHRYGAEDNLPDDETAGPEHFLTNFSTLRHHIETDLISLLNATCLEASLNIGRGDPVNDHGDFATLARDRFPLAAYPHVRRSVVNYGLPSMIGQSIYRLRIEDLENELREAILAYEPRLNKLSVRVERRMVETGSGPEEMDEIDPEKPISFDIQAEIRGKGEAVQVLISTVWDLEKIESRADVLR
ncbi:MAG: type VI secretion system baseplate subunit TssE [Paracoccaceae bacterium]